MVDMFTIPTWALGLVPALTCPSLYALASPHFKTEKQRAYVLSTFSSFCMSCMALPFVYDYLSRGLGYSYVLAQEGWRFHLGRFGVVFFGLYLFMDLAIGYFKYPSQVGLLTGWIHHTVYIALMVHLLHSQQTPIFMSGAIMELPTFDLAISNLFPSVRNDLRFLSTFFLIRIAFHAYFLLDVARPSSRAITEGSWVPTIMLALALAMHVSWFRGGLHGYLKRCRSVRKAQKAAAASDGLHSEMAREKEPKVQAEGEGSSVRFDEPLVDASIAVDPLAADTVLPGTPPARTPDDSPLLTPYTPSVTPMSLRDSYILPALPTLQLPALHMPALPNMPNMHMPQIPSFADLSTAWQKGGGPDIGQFKDAVRNRWEEQRERFGAMALDRADAVRGRARAMNLGGLSLRRRAGRAADGTTVTVQEVDVDA